jgi:hypothetical protein
MLETMFTAIETTGVVDDAHQLRLDAELPIDGPRRVRVIVLYPEDDLDEMMWLKAASVNPAFESLNDPKEDIYSLLDGKPYDDEA